MEHNDPHGATPSAQQSAHTCQHEHLHSHAHTKEVVNRISRALGHLESVRKMVEDGRDCSEVLVQLAAVRAALGSVSRIILKDHIEHCIVHAVEENDQSAISELENAIDKLLK